MITMQNVRIHPQVKEAIKVHSLRESSKNAEAVGFLAQQRGTDRITATVPLNNHAADRSRGYFVEPWEQFRAERKLTDNGYEVAGVYHSHPQGEAFPSGTDKAMARSGELMLIYSVRFDVLTGWLEADGDLTQVSL